MIAVEDLDSSWTEHSATLVSEYFQEGPVKVMTI